MRAFTDPDRVEVEAGEPFAIILSRNFEGPYLWTAADVPPEVHLQGEGTHAPDESAPGAAGEKVFELTATEPGRFTLHFERRFEFGEPKVDRKRAVVVDAR